MPDNNILNVVRSLAEKLGKKQMSFTAAESCTGGWISKTVTDLPGISSVFPGGIVSYANEIKKKLLGVSHSTLAKFGAVSEQTASEMALGAVKAMNADFSIAVTGIAGPGGGTKEKPTGLVFIACADKNGRVSVEKHIFSGGRAEVREQTVEAALIFLTDFVGS